MARQDFKTFYKSEYSSMGTLINEVFPEEVKQMLSYIKLMEAEVDDAIVSSISWLAANLPPYKKYFKDYDQLKLDLEECRKLRKEWEKFRKQYFPIELKNKIFVLYEKWWEAYNDSGAGIRGYSYDPQENRKLYNAVIGKRT